MANIKVKDLTDTQTINTDDEIMVLTDENSNLVQNITVEDFITNVISSDSDNVIEQGTDGKLFVETPVNITGNLSNLTTTNKSTLVGAINEVDGDVGNLANLTTSVKTNVVNAINSEVSARNTAETNIQNDYNGKIGTLSNLDTTDKSNIVGAINELAAIAEPSLQYETMNNSKALETGAPSENAIILADVQKYAHSTFDRSKFTVTGSPNITDDGIASGLSSSNYLTIPFDTSVNNFEISYKFKTGASAASANTFILGGAVQWYMFANGGTMIFYYGNVNSGNTFMPSSLWKVNTNYELKVKLQNNNCNFKLINLDTQTTIKEYDLDVTSATNTNTTLILSKMDNMSIDLKQFSITVDGVPVFSGNKTGLSVIKPDDYTVVGTPTISADGIASGFSGSNYLTIPLSISAGQSFNIKSRYTLGSDLTGTQLLYELKPADSSLDTGNWRPISIRPLGDNNFFIVYPTSATTNRYFTFSTTQVPIAEGQSYDVEVSVAETTFSVTVNGVTITKTDYYPYAITTSKLGVDRNNTNPFKGSIDLNSFKIYINGDLVYQPCLKIPYTESFTGSKIVDAIYRDRVVDAYEQGYPQRFYTIQENKKGNYAVVGSPTISSDFVASGFSSSNYLELNPLNIDWTKPYTIELECMTGNALTYNQVLTSYGMPYLRVWYNGSNPYLQFCPEGTSSSTNVITSAEVVQPNTKYYLKATYDGTNYRFYVKKSSGQLNLVGTLTGSFSISPTLVRIGTQYGDTTRYWNGSIDLKQFSITVDNELAYEAVIDPNFTLPMGEIYGDIENCLNVNAATQDEKNAVIGWGMPDYTHYVGISVTIGTPYNVTENGYFLVDSIVMNNQTCTIKINNVPIMELYYAGSIQITGGMYEVAKGDVIDFSGTSTPSCYFIPCKGEI